MKDEHYHRLSTIADQLLEVCDWLNQKRDLVTVTRLEPIVNDLSLLVAQISVEKSRCEDI